MHHVDIVIVGAGAAGMSLVSQLIRDDIYEYDVLLLDENVKQNNDKTWCYWAVSPLAIYRNSYHQWNKIRMGLDGECFSRKLQSLSYHCIRSGDFYQKIKEEIEQNPRVSFSQEKVTHVRSDSSGARVYTAGGKEYTADWVFDSRPQPELASSLPPNSTWQHFAGIEVSTAQGVFDPEEATLMDFVFPESEEAKFAYVLPFSSNRALVEITVFSQEKIDNQAFEALAHQYIGDRFNTTVSKIHYSESGSIPMTPHRFERRPSPRVMRIGTAGGATRASTGYTFANIQKDSKAIFESLQKVGHPFHGDVQSARARFYDRILLDLMAHEPERIPKLFFDMFKKNHPDRVLRFLDGDTSLYEEISLFFSLPWPPFLKALFRQVVWSLRKRKQSPQVQPIRPVS